MRLRGTQKIAQVVAAREKEFKGTEIKRQWKNRHREGRQGGQIHVVQKTLHRRAAVNSGREGCTAGRRAG